MDKAMQGSQGIAPHVAVDVCPIHGVEHQARDNAVPCLHTGCGRDTFSPHGRCDPHELVAIT